MKQYNLFFVLLVFSAQAKIRRPLFKRFIKKRVQQQKIIAIAQSTKQAKKVKKQENIDNVAIEVPQLSDGCSAVTYDLNGGRFGDNLSSYCRAIWLAYQHNIPLLYKQFTHSGQLALSNYGFPMNKKVGSQFKRRIIIPNHNNYKIIKDNKTLYTVGWKSLTPVDWNDKKFITLLKKCISLASLSSDVKIPPQHISVAVHIRTGGDYNPDKRIRSKQPKRFVSQQFYIDQIKRIQSMFAGRRLYVHIFTDDTKPMSFVKKFKQELGDVQITYGCRQKDNNFHSNVLEDFFAMTRFDCLIRPESLYSIYAERLGNHKVVIYPIQTGFAGRRRKVAVKEIGIKEQTSKGYVTKKVRI